MQIVALIVHQVPELDLVGGVPVMGDGHGSAAAAAANTPGLLVHIF